MAKRWCTEKQEEEVKPTADHTEGQICFLIELILV